MRQPGNRLPLSFDGNYSMVISRPSRMERAMASTIFTMYSPSSAVMQESFAQGAAHKVRQLLIERTGQIAVEFRPVAGIGGVHLSAVISSKPLPQFSVYTTASLPMISSRSSMLVGELEGRIQHASMVPMAPNPW